MVKVKICGFTNTEDVKIACDLGVDMVGAILVPGSLRYLTMDQAKEILAAASEGVAKVAVVEPKKISDLEKFARRLEPDYLQMHLNFKPKELERIKSKLGVGLMVVVPVQREVKNRKDVLAVANRVAKVADVVLVDTKGPTGGGTGLTHDWSISREIRKIVRKPFLLAGGLTPSNVAEAIGIVKPDGVDVATGVESRPGQKDPALMRDFIEIAREKSCS